MGIRGRDLPTELRTYRFKGPFQPVLVSPTDSAKWVRVTIIPSLGSGVSMAASQSSVPLQGPSFGNSSFRLIDGEKHPFLISPLQPLLVAVDGPVLGISNTFVTIQSTESVYDPCDYI